MCLGSSRSLNATSVQYQEVFISYNNQMSLFYDFILHFCKICVLCLHLVLKRSYYADMTDS